MVMTSYAETPGPKKRYIRVQGRRHIPYGGDKILTRTSKTRQTVWQDHELFGVEVDAHGAIV